MHRRKNEKGLTLIELLVVVVILGIIAAIAVPSVGGLIDNARADVHVANAQQMVSSTRLYVASLGVPANGTVTLGDLMDQGFMEPVESPDANAPYNPTTSFVTVTVGENNHYNYAVTLVAGTTTLFNAAPPNQLNRDTINR